MTESAFESVGESCQVLRLDFSSAELAILAQEQELSPEQFHHFRRVLRNTRVRCIGTGNKMTGYTRFCGTTDFSSYCIFTSIPIF